ncbi:WD40-repeat-containing domain protein [Myxozyma melibiosi]|uniref:Serine-threonine kinase receptor-associated protein n=1 Tax=Myxozyma melibiosi TaxID=54550 RepID=A0ABR1FCK8_9ASCO
MTTDSDTVSSRYVPLTLTGHLRPVTHLSFSPLYEDQSYMIISASKDGNPMLRDGITGDWIGTFFGHKGAVWSANFSADAHYSITASADFTAKAWTTETGELLYSLPHNHIVRTAAFMPSRQSPLFAVTAGNEKKIRIWDLNVPDGVTCMEWIGSESIIRCALWLDQNTVVTAGDDKQLKWWDLRTAEKLIEATPLDGPVTQMENREGSLTVAAASSIYLFDWTKRVQLKKESLSYNASTASIHPKRTKFATGCPDDTWVRVHDFESAKTLETLKGHHGPIHSISYSPDGQICASGSEDGTIRLWKAEPGSYGLWNEK